jgi:anti-sigma28 factor (negative regulator of flagellin synthesis)
MANQYRGAKTYEQLQTKKNQAARFARNILKDEDKASFIESESVDEYAERKKIRIKNPERLIDMTKVNDLKEAIVEAVAELDESDGSRTSMFACIDAARDKLADAYGSDFESDLAEHLEETENSEDSDEFEDSDDE